MMPKNRTLQIGQSVPREDAFKKVTGEERYAADYYGKDLLWAGVKRAGIPHARIKGIHTEEAALLPGVIKVLTHKDIKGTNRQGVIRKDQPVLADERVRHAGDGLAMVIAEDRETLQKALDLITLDLEPLEAVLDPERAVMKDAPLIHDDNPGGNILLKGLIEKGDPDSALKKCDMTVEMSFRLPHQEHAYLETESGLAILKDDNRIEIIVSTQTPFRDRRETAEAVGIEEGRIRIIAPYCGGAFGGKDGINVQSLLALACLHCPGRPIKMWWSREESFLASCKRHPAVITCRLGASSDGLLQALDTEIVFDTGPYDHLGGAVMALGMEHACGPYRIPDVRISARAVYTNNPIGGAFRGFGVPQVAAAMEQMMDILAKKCGISPIEIRLLNAVAKGDKNPLGTTMTGSTGMLECLETLERDPAWTDREKWKAGAGPFKVRGTGIASAMHGMGYGPLIPDTANAKIELTRDGRFRVYSGVVDMGQGNASTCLQIAGDILNQEMTRMELVLPDTDRTLPSGSASASRTTYTFGNALIDAARILKERILNRISDMMMIKGAEEMALIPGAVRHLPSGKEISLADAARMMTGEERIVTSRFRAPVAGDAPTKDQALRIHGIPHTIFSYGAHLACVEIDELTGRVEVLKYVAVSDCGRIINPQIFQQQIQGGISQGIGYALYEDFIMDKGSILTKDLSTYIIPTALDIPDMKSIAVELPEHTGPFGLKGAGEIAIDAPLPAIANGIADACHVRIERFPLTPERILEALEKGQMRGDTA